MKKKIAVLALLAIAITSFTCYSAAAVEGNGIRLAFEKVGDDLATVTAGRLNVTCWRVKYWGLHCLYKI